MRGITYLLILGCFLIKSCVKDVDFDQIDDIEVNTTHNISLINFKMNSSDFLDDLENEVLLRSDTTGLPIFGGSYTVNYLNQAELKYKFSNTFDRSISLEMEFLDEYNTSLFTLQRIHIKANVSDVEVLQTLDELALQKLPSTERVVVKLLLSVGNPPLDPNQDYILTSQVATLLYYKVTTIDE